MIPKSHLHRRFLCALAWIALRDIGQDGVPVDPRTYELLRVGRKFTRGLAKRKDLDAAHEEMIGLYHRNGYRMDYFLVKCALDDEIAMEAEAAGTAWGGPLFAVGYNLDRLMETTAKRVPQWIEWIREQAPRLGIVVPYIMEDKQ